MSAISPSEPPRAAAESPLTGKILVADDEFRVRDLCHLILDKMGCQVVAVSSGEEALAHLSPDVDIVLTDLNMPGKVGGRELAAHARAGERTDVIIMTGFPDTDSAVQAVKNGVYDYLIKPFNAATLRISVQRCLQKRDIFRQLRREKEVKAEIDRTYEELAWSLKIKGIYGQFTSPEVVQMVMERPADFWKKGEERDATLLLAEVSNFWQTVPNAAPEEKIEILNKVLNFLSDAIQAEMGHIFSLKGETVGALFGAPVPLLEHTEAAIRAARRMKKLWDAFSGSQKSKKLAGLSLKIALHSGKVVTGCLGIKTGTEYGVIGPVARGGEDLLRTAKPGQVLASRETARRAKGAAFRNHGLLIGSPYQDEVWELSFS